MVCNCGALPGSGLTAGHIISYGPTESQSKARAVDRMDESNEKFMSIAIQCLFLLNLGPNMCNNCNNVTIG